MVINHLGIPVKLTQTLTITVTNLLFVDQKPRNTQRGPSCFAIPKKACILEFQTAILSIQCTQHFCHNVRMGIICFPFLRGRKLFSNVFQKWHCFSLSGVFHVLLFSSMCWNRITVVVSTGSSGVPVFSSAVTLESTYPFLLRKENKTKFFFPVFPPYPLPPHLQYDKCVSSDLKTYPQKYKNCLWNNGHS